MAEERGADRSSIEIKTLIRKLHPKRGNHKDRIRQLNKFRNYVIGDRVCSGRGCGLCDLLCRSHAVLDRNRVLPSFTMMIYPFSGSALLLRPLILRK